MGVITSIRAPLPVAEAPGQAASAPRRAVLPEGVSGAPVAIPDMPKAVPQAGMTLFAPGRQTLMPPTPVETSAALAAEAARTAYIKASIAAGISPLPLG